MTVAALRELLAEIDAQGGAAAARAGRLDLPDPVLESRIIRAWAVANGIDCPPGGSLPHRVVAAWQVRREAA